jgi:hypothetical protein
LGNLHCSKQVGGDLLATLDEVDAVHRLVVLAHVVAALCRARVLCKQIVDVRRLIAYKQRR